MPFDVSVVQDLFSESQRVFINWMKRTKGILVLTLNLDCTTAAAEIAIVFVDGLKSYFKIYYVHYCDYYSPKMYMDGWNEERSVALNTTVFWSILSSLNPKFFFLSMLQKK